MDLIHFPLRAFNSSFFCSIYSDKDFITYEYSNSIIISGMILMLNFNWKFDGLKFYKLNNI